MDNTFPKSYFGPVDRPPLDWRKYPDADPDPDDTEIETPAYLIAMLGFDPLEFSDESDAEQADAPATEPPPEA